MQNIIDPGVYFNIYDVEDLRKTGINYLTLTVDLQNQGHKYILLWPSVYLWLYI